MLFSIFVRSSSYWEKNERKKNLIPEPRWEKGWLSTGLYHNLHSSLYHNSQFLDDWTWTQTLSQIDTHTYRKSVLNSRIPELKDRPINWLLFTYYIHFKHIYVYFASKISCHFLFGLRFSLDPAQRNIFKSRTFDEKYLP